MTYNTVRLAHGGFCSRPPDNMGCVNWSVCPHVPGGKNARIVSPMVPKASSFSASEHGEPRRSSPTTWNGTNKHQATQHYLRRGYGNTNRMRQCSFSVVTDPETCLEDYRKHVYGSDASSFRQLPWIRVQGRKIVEVFFCAHGVVPTLPDSQRNIRGQTRGHVCRRWL